MRAHIQLVCGDYAIADYNQRTQTWEIDRGLEDVVVPTGVSAIVALRAFHPSARLVFHGVSGHSL